MMRTKTAITLILLFSRNLHAQDLPDYAGVNHVEFYAPDVERSVEFYTRLFDVDVYKHNGADKFYLPAGLSYFVIMPGEQVATDHFCFGADNFNVDNAHRYFDSQQIAWHDYPSGRDFYVNDPDGNLVQITRMNNWAPFRDESTTRWHTGMKTGIFQVIRLDGVALNVSDPGLAAPFYTQVLGKAGSSSAGAYWFEAGNGSLKLNKTPVGQSTGLAYFTFLVEDTDFAAAADKVAAAGGIVETIMPDGLSFWDPDGHRVQVHSGGMY